MLQENLNFIQVNLKQIHENVAAACQRAGREASSVTLVNVSKTRPTEYIMEAYAFGERHFGENRPQELRNKSADLVGKDIKWHMIGSLQTNKIKYVAGEAVLIHSVDSIKLAEALSEYAQKKEMTISILLEINLTKEESKHGFLEEELFSAVTAIAAMPHLIIRGLMTVAKETTVPEENRIYFHKLKQLLIDINLKNIDNVHMSELSMGMTGDYEIAIEEGATLIRIGSGIFGKRDYSKQ